MSYGERVTHRERLKKLSRHVKWLNTNLGFIDSASAMGRSTAWVSFAGRGKWDKIKPTSVDCSVAESLYTLYRTRNIRDTDAIKHFKSAARLSAQAVQEVRKGVSKLEQGRQMLRRANHDKRR